MDTNDKKYSAPAVEKMLNLIELLAKSENGYSINELSRLTDSSLNTIYRICMVLRNRNYLVMDPRSGYYVLGSGFYFIGKAAEKRMKLNVCAQPILNSLSEETGETAHLTVLADNKLILLTQAETSQPIRMQVETGTTMEAHCSAFGKCIIAYSSDEYIDKFISGGLKRLTKYTITDGEILRRELAQIRRDGIAFDKEEYVYGLHCVGAPVFGKSGECIAGMGVMFPIFRVDDETESRFIGAVKESAAELSRKMGVQT